jgi:hypothetical protein
MLRRTEPYRPTVCSKAGFLIRLPKSFFPMGLSLAEELCRVWYKTGQLKRDPLKVNRQMVYQRLNISHAGSWCSHRNHLPR